MKKTFVAFLLFFLNISCNNKNSAPDVSGIKATVQLERFDKDFFAIDSNNIIQGLNRLSSKYPDLTSIYIQQILGVENGSPEENVRQFLRYSGGLKDTVNVVFKSTEDLQQQFLQAFKYVKYYFPGYQVPKIVTVVGPLDALAQGTNGPTPNFLRPGFLGISLQFYLGRDYSAYQHPFFIENVAPSYRSRRFSKEYIVADALPLVIDNLFPDSSNDKPLVEQMIEKGKRWWLLDKFLPNTPDSVKTGYTQQQLDWCNNNEGLIWSYIVKQGELYSINPATIQTYIGEGPFTQGFSQELSPGNIGQWIGWQIVKKFADKNPGMPVDEVMLSTPKKILDEAKYKPK